MLLAAGRGKRMLTFTKDTPKPLLKVAKKPILLRIIESFQTNNIKNFIINTSYLSERIYDFAAEINPSCKNKILVSYERKRLETGGGIKAALKLLPQDNFLTINGDSLIINGKSGNPYMKLKKSFAKNMDILLLLAPINKCIGYQGIGDFCLKSNKSPYIISRADKSSNNLVYTGWQFINPRVFNKIKELNFSMNLIYDNAMNMGKLYGIIHDGLYLHISDPDSLKLAENFF